jgi:hypothetical protein
MTFIKPKGAFYFSVTFDFDSIHKDYRPKVGNDEVEKIVSKIIDGNTRFDKKFCYYLLACK